MGTTDLEVLELVFRSVDMETLRARDPSITGERLRGLLDSLKGKLGSDVASALPTEEIVLYVDGAARGNPGKAGIGVVLRDKRGKVIEEAGQYIGETTNNVAEYRALLEGLRRSLARGVKGVEIFSDSELMVRQINGKYRVKSPSLLHLYMEAMKLLNNLTHWKIAHIPREQNSRADALANMAIDSQKGNRG
ncbi:MAG TPA: ribonuclease HI family protein [Candidatus Tripitaka californicus]|uniref:ribonuclease HI family protein n=2 Tax=Candidatus Tripitaka californicus TaxID=3367616 RepID=UPI004028894F